MSLQRVRGRSVHHREEFSALLLGAIGVVFGDIGTSPLYAIRECFLGTHGVPLNHDNVLGILSLIFWSITFVVSLKYLLVVMRATNKGEGGIMALISLLMRKGPEGRKPIAPIKVLLLGLFGAALLYGDGVITPAISVLSAIEGLKMAAPRLGDYVVPLTVLVLVALFSIQKKGTGKVGGIFGPILVVWFIAIAAVALPWIAREPHVLSALNPLLAIRFFFQNGWQGFAVLSAVVLCITGGEALYADMGHFGIRPIRTAWYTLVMPCLVLNYFGQGAYLLSMGAEAVENPFYGLVPQPLLLPMIVLATAATVIASQALISGAYSMTSQAMQLGYLPRILVVHTSAKQEGQIFIPIINALLMVSCIALVLLFRESGSLAAAYGIAVTGTMTITTLLFFVVARQIWGWGRGSAFALVLLFLGVDLSFLGSNLLKLFHGGIVPVVMAMAVFVVMTTWHKGRAILAQAMVNKGIPLDEFLNRVREENPIRVPGTAIFMTPNTDIAPPVLIQNLRHNRVLHEKVVLLTINAKKVPYIAHDEHARLSEIGMGFCKVVAKYGFMERPNVAEVLKIVGILEEDASMQRDDVSFYLGRETLVMDSEVSRFARWRKKLFVMLSRNAQPASLFFQVPSNQVIEIGSQIKI